MTPRPAETVRRLLEVLERRYGRPPRLPAGEPADLLVYLFIEDAAGKKAADAALRRLKKTFVDWNEVRVTGLKALEACLGEVPRERRAETAQRIRNALVHLYEAHFRDGFTPEEVTDPDRLAQCFAALEGLDAGRAALIAWTHLAARDPDGVAPLQAVQRILTRVGLMRRTSSPRVARESVAALVPAGEELRLVYLLARHGEEVCGRKSYSCSQCAAVRLCAMGRRLAPPRARTRARRKK